MADSKNQKMFILEAWEGVLGRSFDQPEPDQDSSQTQHRPEPTPAPTQPEPEPTPAPSQPEPHPQGSAPIGPASEDDYALYEYVYGVFKGYADAKKTLERLLHEARDHETQARDLKAQAQELTSQARDHEAQALDLKAQARDLKAQVTDFEKRFTF